MDKVSRIKCLTTELVNACRDYYNTGTSNMSDAEYDIKLKELEQLEKECNYSMSNSPVNKVGYEVITGQTKVTHTVPMLSLAKVHSAKEIIDFAKGESLVAMYKLDGISLRAIYSGENGNLIGLESRGNGVEGTDLYYQRYSFENLPLHIDVDRETIIDGEALIMDNDFAAINNSLPASDKYSHSRNLAAGSLSLLDTSISSKRHLKMIVWDVIKGCDWEDNFDERLNWAKEKGFDIVGYSVQLFPNKLLSQDDIDLINDNMMKNAKEDEYGVDGVVWKLRSVKLGKSKGKTEHHFCSAVAWKPNMTAYETTLRDIVFSTSKTGRINPVAIFDELDLDGALTTRCTLNNISYIEDLELGIGDRIQIIRSNFVIPKIVGNLTRSNTFVIPKVCPCCGYPTEIKNDNGSKTLYCTNTESCEAQFLSRLELFVSKEGMDIDGLSTAQLQTFIDQGWLHDVSDIFSLKEHKTEMLKLDKMGEKSVAKLLNAIDNAQHYASLSSFIRSLGVPMIGKKQSKEIATYCDNDINMFCKVLYEKKDLSKVLNGFGERMNASLHNWFANEENSHVFAKLLTLVTFEKVINNTAVTQSKKLNNASFCITGKLIHFSNRDALVASIEANGGIVVSGVTSKTNYLLTNDTTSGSSKNKKAAQLGIPVITEEEYLKLIGGE